MTKKFLKDPDAVLDYKFDWSDWLDDGEAILSHSITETTGITIDSDSMTDASTSVTVWLSGGESGASYSVTCHVVTSDGRQDDRSITIVVGDR